MSLCNPPQLTVSTSKKNGPFSQQRSILGSSDARELLTDLHVDNPRAANAGAGDNPVGLRSDDLADDYRVLAQGAITQRRKNGFRLHCCHDCDQLALVCYTYIGPMLCISSRRRRL